MSNYDKQWNVVQALKEKLLVRGYKYDFCNWTFHKGKITIRVDKNTRNIWAYFENYIDGRCVYTTSWHNLNFLHELP